MGPPPGDGGAPSSSRWRTASGQLVITSGVTIVFEACMGHQLEYVKIVRQTTMAPYARIVTDIVRRRGIAGFWDGFVPWGVTQAATKGAVFGYAHATLRKVTRPLQEHMGLSSGVRDTVCGAGAGGVQGLVLSPTLLLKTRVMTDPSYRRAAATGTLRATFESFRVGVSVVVREGPLSLMTGAGTFATKRMADWGSRYAFTNLVEAQMTRRSRGPTPQSETSSAQLSYPQRILASLVGGVLSTVCTIPLDVLVANIQKADAAGKNVSLAGAFVDSFRVAGFDGLFGFAFRGFAPRCLHVALTTVVVKTGTQYVQDRLDPPVAPPSLVVPR